MHFPAEVWEIVKSYLFDKKDIDYRLFIKNRKIATKLLFQDSEENRKKLQKYLNLMWENEKIEKRQRKCDKKRLEKIQMEEHVQTLIKKLNISRQLKGT